MYRVDEHSRTKYITQTRKVWIPKYQDIYEEKNNTPHYIELNDNGNVFFSSKSEPVFFEEKYDKENHRKWWNDYEDISKGLREKVINMLLEKYPNYADINAYWN